MESKHLENLKYEKMRQSMATRRRRLRHCVWAARAAILLAFIWTCGIQLPQVWRSSWQSAAAPRPVTSPLREYENNGYIILSSNGGLNQMRSGICDMVAIARYMNATLVVPQLDNTSFWQDQSQFKDVFDVDYFINSLRDEVKIVKELPPHMLRKIEMEQYIKMPPVSWSSISYYTDKILPEVLQKHNLLHFNKTDSRLENNAPLEVQKLRCRVNYEALKFTAPIEETGKRIVKILRERGEFLVLHLRYEKDMLAYSGCNEGCTNHEAKELQELRDSIQWWKIKDINSTSARLDGLCPLTPEETVLTLKALGVDRKTQIYIAAGDIYGGEKRLAGLRAAYPNLVKKETLLPRSELLPFKKYASQMAALDYIVSLESDIFFPTYEGNMAKVVEGHRRYLGFKKTIQIDQKVMVNLIDKYRKDRNWKEFELAVKRTHERRIGNPAKRKVIPGKPKEEDYFWSNPHECFTTSR